MLQKILVSIRKSSTYQKDQVKFMNTCGPKTKPFPKEEPVSYLNRPEYVLCTARKIVLIFKGIEKYILNFEYNFGGEFATFFSNFRL